MRWLLTFNEAEKEDEKQGRAFRTLIPDWPLQRKRRKMGGAKTTVREGKRKRRNGRS